MVRRYPPTQQQIGFLLWDAARSMSRAFGIRIARHGLNLGVFPFLRALWEEDGLTQRQLAERVRMTGPTTLAAIRKLERDGFVRQFDDPSDRRKVNVFLTNEGRRLHDIAMPEVWAIRRLCLAGFSPAEKEQLKLFLQRYRANIRRAEVGAAKTANGKPAPVARPRRPRPGGKRAGTPSTTLRQ